MEKLYIIKIGGNVIDDPLILEKFLADFSVLPGHKILVHGGGKLATELAGSLGIKQTMIEGRRVTDKATLDVTLMVYAGLINKTLVAKLQSMQCKVMGFCGADGNLIRSEKRSSAEIDFGFVGDILPGGVDVEQFAHLLDQGIVPVISPITHDGNGNLLNTNADSVASGIALGMRSIYEVTLVYCFERKGVLTDMNDDNSFIPLLNKHNYSELKEAGVISKGMIPKLDNAFHVSEAGIQQLVICHAADVLTITTQLSGTQLSL